MTAKLFTISFDSQPYTFTGEGWFNATQAASRFGKEPYMWLRQRETVEYIAALAEINGNSDFVEEFNKIIELSSTSSLSQSKLLALVKKTGFVRTKAGSPETGGGTWLNPKLAVVFARWLDVRFAIWCDLQIDKILRASYAPPDIMQLLLTNTASEWELRFPACFYHALAKMTGTKYQGHNHGTPALFGNITLKWVYSEIMPPDVLAEVKTRKKDSEKIHQWLSIGGAKSLDQQITKIQTIAETSTDFKDFEGRCYQASAKAKGQLRLVYP